VFRGKVSRKSRHGTEKSVRHLHLTNESSEELRDECDLSTLNSDVRGK
jgi:hypothetical protein